jgi:hypothetical protein
MERDFSVSVNLPVEILKRFDKAPKGKKPQTIKFVGF